MTTYRSELSYRERPPSGDYSWPNNGDIYERMRCSLLVEADKAEAEGNAQANLDKVGLGDRGDAYPAQLSGGGIDDTSAPATSGGRVKVTSAGSICGANCQPIFDWSAASSGTRRIRSASASARCSRPGAISADVVA